VVVVVVVVVVDDDDDAKDEEEDDVAALCHTDANDDRSAAAVPNSAPTAYAKTQRDAQAHLLLI
jgi:hypothetical protein